MLATEPDLTGWQEIVLILGLFFFFLVMFKGWPWQGNDDNDQDDYEDLG